MPVIYEEPSEARKTAEEPISSDLANLFNGVFLE
jgi:hypothetical protein